MQEVRVAFFIWSGPDHMISGTCSLSHWRDISHVPVCVPSNQLLCQQKTLARHLLKACFKGPQHIMLESSSYCCKTYLKQRLSARTARDVGPDLHAMNNCCSSIGCSLSFCRCHFFWSNHWPGLWWWPTRGSHRCIRR